MWVICSNTLSFLEWEAIWNWSKNFQKQKHDRVKDDDDHSKADGQDRPEVRIAKMTQKRKIHILYVWNSKQKQGMSSGSKVQEPDSKFGKGRQIWDRLVNPFANAYL